MYFEQVTQWVERMEKQGYRLVGKPSTPERRPSPDPMEPGYDWYVVRARWMHDGPVAVLRDQDYHAKREEEERIGAGQLTGDGGVTKYLKEHEADGLGDVSIGGGERGRVAGAD